MAAVNSANSTTTDVQKRAKLRIVSQRRRRVWLNLTLFVAATAIVVVLSMANRDSETIRRNERFVADVTARFQADYVKRPLPARMPLDEDLEEQMRNSWRNRFCYVPRNQWRFRDGDERVAVCYHDHPLMLFLRADGRHVIFYDGQRYWSQWTPEDELRRRADEWGLALLDD